MPPFGGFDLRRSRCADQSKTVAFFFAPIKRRVSLPLGGALLLHVIHFCWMLSVVPHWNCKRVLQRPAASQPVANRVTRDTGLKRPFCDGLLFSIQSQMSLPLFNRPREGVIGCPTGVQPTNKDRILNSVFLGPSGGAFCFQPDCHHSRLSQVSGLLLWCLPLTVLRTIVPVIVNPTKGMFQRRALSHTFKKRPKELRHSSQTEMPRPP